MRHRHGHGRRHRHGRRFGPWAWEGRFFEKGELPLALLSILADGPRHGYDLMKRIEELSGGLYQPSPGTIYPTLQQLQDQELVTSHADDGGKRTYALTEAGRALVDKEAETVKSIWERAEDEEWGGWGGAFDPRASEIMRPAFRLMRTAVRTVSRGDDPDRVDQVRDILKRACQEIRNLSRDPSEA